MKKLFIALVFCGLLFSCEKETCYPIVQKDHVVYTFEGDTIADYYENVNTSQQFCGSIDEVDAWAKSQSFRVTTVYECGGEVDGVHYEPLTEEITHMTIYLVFN